MIRKKENTVSACEQNGVRVTINADDLLAFDFSIENEYLGIKDFKFMLAHNKSGWTLLEYLKVNEDEIGDYDNVTGAFAVISVNGEYLIGFNSWRQQWEFPAGGIEAGETAREAAIRELYEETHQCQTDLDG